MDMFADMDFETATLILQLQLEDSNELFESCEGKGKGREGELSDSQVAFQTYKEDLERTAAIVADRKMSSSIARACVLDSDVVVESLFSRTGCGRRSRHCLHAGRCGCPLFASTMDSWF